jgi:hypothetical protein
LRRLPKRDRGHQREESKGSDREAHRRLTS